MSALGPSPTAIYTGPFGEEQATRLLWRAGFGPKPGDAERYAKLGMEAAVASLTRPQGKAQLIGKAPHDDKGHPLDPFDVWGDDHCWWLDRMVRSNRPLIERMTLIWHSWFATSEEASSARLMINQNWTFRRNALGNFKQLLPDVTIDPAMLLWLNGNTNNKYSPNENYGREMLELFTLGQGRGYGQDDVHQNARALTGWTNDWSDTRGPGQLPLRGRPARRRRQEDPRPRRALQLEGQRATSRSTTTRTPRSSSRSSGATSSAPSCPSAPRASSRTPTSAAASRSARSSRRSCATRCSTRARAW